SEPFPCTAVTSSGVVCDCQMDVYGDHALCCHNGPSLLFRHNSIRDILGHAARAAGLSAVVIEKKNQVEGSNAKPGDIPSNITIVASRLPLLTSLQKKYLDIAMAEAGVVAKEAHDRKLLK